MNIYSWDKDTSLVNGLIKEKKLPLKIIVKVKDDLDMLKKFIDHHSRIVTSESIIVFDNNSLGVDYNIYLEELSQHCLVIRFSSFHNDLHNVEKFKNLYESLQESSQFYTFLDADERVAYINNDECIADSRLVDKLMEQDRNNVIYGTWLSNLPGIENKFKIRESDDDLMKGRAWGKPIIGCKANITGFINHNIQLVKNIGINNSTHNFFILHLNNLSATQRINANIRKLKARGFIENNTNVEDVVSLKSIETDDFNIKLYVEEIIRLKNGSKLMSSSESVPHIEIFDNGNIDFYCNGTYRYFKKYLLDSEVKYDVIDNSFLKKSIKSNKDINYHLEVFDTDLIKGWAVDKFGDPCKITVKINNINFAYVVALARRTDLKKSNLSSGLGGFVISIKNVLKIGTNKIEIIISNDSHATKTICSNIVVN